MKEYLKLLSEARTSSQELLKKLDEAIFVVNHLDPSLIAASPELIAAAMRVIYPKSKRDYAKGKEALARAIAKI